MSLPTYGQPPDYDALSPVGCYAVRFFLSSTRVPTVPAFNMLRADPLRANQVPDPAAATASADGIKAVAPPTSSALLDRLASDEVQDVPLRRGARSRKESPRITTRVQAW